MAEVTKENWLDSLPSTPLEGVNDEVNMIRTYEMMNGACEEEKEDKTFEHARVGCQGTICLPLEKKKRKEILRATT